MALAGCNDVAAVPVRRVADARGFARLRSDALWRREWRRYATLAAVTALGAGAFGVLRRIDPNVAGNPLPPCPLRALTGLYCPGCGSTRTLHALLHGDLATAMAMNPLLVVSHNPEQAVRLGERLVILADGHVRQVFERGQVDGEAVARALADAG